MQNINLQHFDVKSIKLLFLEGKNLFGQFYTAFSRTTSIVLGKKNTYVLARQRINAEIRFGDKMYYQKTRIGWIKLVEKLWLNSYLYLLKFCRKYGLSAESDRYYVFTYIMPSVQFRSWVIVFITPHNKTNFFVFRFTFRKYIGGSLLQLHYILFFNSHTYFCHSYSNFKCIMVFFEGKIKAPFYLFVEVEGDGEGDAEQWIVNGMRK